MKKKFLTAALTAAVALGCAITSFAAEPVASFSFDDSSKTELYGDAAITANPDDSSDNVLCVETGTGGANGNYALVSEGFLEGYDFSNGVTISMNIRPTTNSSDWNYVFCLGASGTATDVTSSGWAYLDGTIGFIARHGDTYCAYFPSDGWADGNEVSSQYNYFLQSDNCDKWYKLTYVFSDSNISIYLDGVLTTSWTVTESSIADILSSLDEHAALVLGAGASRGDFENFGGYIDDVMIYASALSADEVSAIPDKADTDVIDTEDDAETDDTDDTISSPTGDDAETDDTISSPSGDDAETDDTDDTDDDVIEATAVTAEVAAAISEAAVVTSQSGDVLDVVLTAAPVEDETLATTLVNANEALQAAGIKAFAVLDLTLTVDGTSVTLLDEKINVNIPMDGIFTDIEENAVIAVYRIDNDALSFLGTSTVASDKTITFATEHFSQYVFVVVEDAEALSDVSIVDYITDIDTTATADIKVADISVLKDATVNTDSNEETGDTSPIMPLVILAVVALGAVVAVAVSKKRA